ncbi:MAG: hypothetical protein FD124_3812, partial [Alphaproteobacteria bacterium]
SGRQEGAARGALVKSPCPATLSSPRQTHARPPPCRGRRRKMCGDRCGDARAFPAFPVQHLALRQAQGEGVKRFCRSPLAGEKGSLGACQLFAGNGSSPTRPVHGATGAEGRLGNRTRTSFQKDRADHGADRATAPLARSAGCQPATPSAGRHTSKCSNVSRALRGVAGKLPALRAGGAWSVARVRSSISHTDEGGVCFGPAPTPPIARPPARLYRPERRAGVSPCTGSISSSPACLKSCGRIS